MYMTIEQAQSQKQSANKKQRDTIKMPNPEAIVNAMGTKSLVFVGMMGCGKTAIGRITASALGLKFYDADKEIEHAADLSVPEIFEKYGEAYFRSGEEKVIQRLLKDGPCVLSLGGGAFMSEATRKACEELAISVWLKADIEILLTRVMKRPGTRPILQTGNPRQTLIDLSIKRDPIYALADLHVESSKISKGRTRDTLLIALAKHLGTES